MCMLLIAIIAVAKVVNYFELSKKNRFWGLFFWCREHRKPEYHSGE